MEAYEVEEKMRLKTEPKLSFLHSIRAAGSIGSNRRFGLLFGLENVSTVTAKFPSYHSAKEEISPALPSMVLMETVTICGRDCTMSLAMR